MKNLTYSFSWLKKESGAKTLLLCVGDVLLEICFPFVAMALPSAIISFLTSTYTASTILLLIIGYVAILQLIKILQTHLKQSRITALFLFRLNGSKDFSRKCLTMDYQMLESTTGQKKRQIAEECLFSGNERGIEALLIAYLETAINLGGMLIYAVIIGMENLYLLGGLLLLTGAVAYSNWIAGKKSYQYNEDFFSNHMNFAYLKKEALVVPNGKDIRLYRMDHWFAKEFRALTDTAVFIEGKTQNAFFYAGVCEKLLSLLRDGIIYGFLILQMVHGQITLSQFLLYIGIVAGFGTWMSGLFTSVQHIFQNNPVVDGYRSFVEEDFDTKRILAKPSGVPTLSQGNLHELTLSHVCFRYEGQDGDAIHDISLTIHPGEKLALVGMNGAGKSTLIKLLCGLYRPTAGQIFLDGIDIQTLSSEDYWKEFSIVFQDVFAFSFPLEDNVSCKEPSQLDSKRLHSVLEKAGLLEKIASLPKGTGTMMNKDLDEEGVTLSGGELQKLMLARALYKNAPIVILDEPTAALDPIAESNMYEKYYDMTKDKTSIFISHRLSSTRFCDRILFMEHGSITEEGSHDSLLSQNGSYANMYRIQAHYYQKEMEAKCFE